jgi:hypothetical protein
VNPRIPSTPDSRSDGAASSTTNAVARRGSAANACSTANAPTEAPTTGGTGNDRSTDPRSQAKASIE